MTIATAAERAEYYGHVQVCVDVIEERLEADNGEDIANLVWQEVDSSQYIIYYSNNLLILEISENEPEEWKHLVGDTDSWRDVIQAMAYKVLEQDIWDEIHDRDLHD